jgi:hypothetical protein
VPLSEHEQRLLNEIEQALYAEDPKFVSSVRSARPRNRTRLLLLLSVVGVVAGLAVVVIALATWTLLGVVGFVLIVASIVCAASALRGPAPSDPTSAHRPNDSRTGKSHSLRTKMEDRMRRRFDEN